MQTRAQHAAEGQSALRLAPSFGLHCLTFANGHVGAVARLDVQKVAKANLWCASERMKASPVWGWRDLAPALPEAGTSSSWRPALLASATGSCGPSAAERGGGRDCTLQNWQSQSPAPTSRAFRQKYVLASYTGLRPNELRALKRADVDLDAGTITVSRVSERATKSTKAPKTRAGPEPFPSRPRCAR